MLITHVHLSVLRAHAVFFQQSVSIAMNFTGEWVFTVPRYTLGTWNTRNRRAIFMDCSGVDDLNWAWWGYSCSQWQNWAVNVQLSSFGFSLLENSSPLREMSSVNKLITQLWDQWSFLGRFEGHSFTRLYKTKWTRGGCAVSWPAARAPSAALGCCLALRIHRSATQSTIK